MMVLSRDKRRGERSCSLELQYGQNHSPPGQVEFLDINCPAELRLRQLSGSLVPHLSPNTPDIPIDPGGASPPGWKNPPETQHLFPCRRSRTRAGRPITRCSHSPDGMTWDSLTHGNERPGAGLREVLPDLVRPGGLSARFDRAQAEIDHTPSRPANNSGTRFPRGVAWTAAVMRHGLIANTQRIRAPDDRLVADVPRLRRVFEQLPKKTSPGCTSAREFRVILLCPTVLFWVPKWLLRRPVGVGETAKIGSCA
jgi:hypothetical protein